MKVLKTLPIGCRDKPFLRGSTVLYRPERIPVARAASVVLFNYLGQYTTLCQASASWGHENPKEVQCCLRSTRRLPRALSR